MKDCEFETKEGIEVEPLYLSFNYFFFNEKENYKTFVGSLKCFTKLATP